MGFLKMRKVHKVYKEAESVVRGWILSWPEPIPDTLEEFVQRAGFDLNDMMTLRSLYRLLVDSQKVWQDADGLIAKRLRDIAAIVIEWNRKFDTGNPARNLWEKEKYQRSLLARVSWVMATPASPDEIRKPGSNPRITGTKTSGGRSLDRCTATTRGSTAKRSPQTSG